MCVFSGRGRCYKDVRKKVNDKTVETKRKPERKNKRRGVLITSSAQNKTHTLKQAPSNY